MPRGSAAAVGLQTVCGKGLRAGRAEVDAAGVDASHRERQREDSCRSAPDAYRCRVSMKAACLDSLQPAEREGQFFGVVYLTCFRYLP